MFDRIVCVLVRIKVRGHLVMSIIQFMNLISVHFWTHSRIYSFSVPFSVLDSCDFDNGNMCNWKTPGNKRPRWVVYTGSTTSNATGPSSDHSGSDTGTE